MRDHRDVIIRPVISEKSYEMISENKYTFVVDPRANKTQIRQAVEAIFAVRVLSVNTLNPGSLRVAVALTDSPAPTSATSVVLKLALPEPSVATWAKPR